jgi:exonuclease SbcD
VHTSDWHLGRRLGEASLVDDQAHAVSAVLDVCRDARADALVIAGDVFDRAVPPVDALALWEDVIGRAAAAGLPVVVAAGNHDSPERLGFARALLATQGIHVITRIGERVRPVVVAGLPLYVLPFCEPEAARAALGRDDLKTHDAAVRAALDGLRPDGPAVLVAHCFAAGGRESIDSERPIAVGNAGQVGADAFDGWSYVALGHLHAPQAVGGREHVRYSGSLLKYSFGEADQRKGVTVVEVDARGGARAEHVPITPRHDVVRIEGAFDELLRDARFAPAEDAFVEATYTDAGYVVDAAARLRVRFSRLMAARPRQVLRQIDGGTLAAARSADDRELLAGFWQHVQEGGELEPAHLEAWNHALAEARAGERETLGVVP